MRRDETRQLEAQMKLLILPHNRPLTGASHDAVSTVQAATTLRQIVPMVHASENENAAATTPLMEIKSSGDGGVWGVGGGGWGCLQRHNKI